MKIIILFTLFVGVIPFAFAENDKGFFDWKFCNGEILFPYSIINGTLKETIHLKLSNTNECNNEHSTNYQLQLLHTSNNQTSFNLGLPENLDFTEIKVRVVDRYSVETFWLNDTSNRVELNNFTHDRFGFITIILDLIS